MPASLASLREVAGATERDEMIHESGTGFIDVLEDAGVLFSGEGGRRRPRRPPGGVTGAQGHTLSPRGLDVWPPTPVVACPSAPSTLPFLVGSARSAVPSRA
jgi:hypothetical protein